MSRVAGKVYWQTAENWTDLCEKVLGHAFRLILTDKAYTHMMTLAIIFSVLKDVNADFLDA